MNMKKKILITCMFVMMIFSIACGKEKEHLVDLKGAFVLNPDNVLDLSKEDLEKNQKLLIIVYDVFANGDSNEEINPFQDAVSVECNKTNEYEQLYQYNIKTFDKFVESSGYVYSTDVDTIWGGSEPIRMISVFAINENDLKGEFVAEIKFDLSSNIKDEWKLSNQNIKEISLYDEMFCIVEQEELYQISRSIPARNEMIYQCIQSASISWKSGDVAGLNLAAATMQTMYSEDTKWGVSSGTDYSNSIIVSEKLGTYTSEALNLLEDEVAQAVRIFINDVDELVHMLSNPTMFSGKEVSAKMNDVIAQKEDIDKMYNID